MIPGTRLGPYEIVEQLGAGGMGEVYRARDTKLDRDIAIKVIPDLLAGDVHRQERFTREAKVLAALNHPNIAAIYGLEEAGGVRFIVMEFAEGESLQQRLERGPLGCDETVAIARQVAAALATAHRAGIVHRDVKPGNIVVTKDGCAKVLDFGIAKVIEEPSATARAARATELTEAGVMIGTAPYMSPEQVRGGPIDQRSDVWSFGCLLYEMLVGHGPFRRDHAADTMSAILEAPADLDALPREVPRAVRDLVAECLCKETQERLPDLGEARDRLDSVLGRPAVGAPGSVSSGRRPAAAAAALLVVVAMLSGWWMLRGSGAGPGEGAGAPQAAGERPERGPSIAVLPFENASGDPEQDYFADGLTADIITELSHYRELSVFAGGVTPSAAEDHDVREVGAAFGARYVLGGSVRRAGQRIRVGVQLSDSQDGRLVWGTNYERDLTARDLFDIQDELTQQVVTAIAGSYGALTRAELPAARRKSPASLDSYDCVVRVYEYLQVHTAPNHLAARECLEEFAARDPEYVDAQAWLGYIYAEEYHHRRNERPGEYAALERARGLAERAVSLDNTNHVARGTLALVLMFSGDYERGKAEAYRTIELSPNDALWLSLMGIYLVQLEDFEGGMPMVRRSAALNATPPRWLPMVFFFDHYHHGRYEEALEQATAVVMDGDFREALFLAAAYGQVGRGAEAAPALADLAMLWPYSDEEMRDELIGRHAMAPGLTDHILEGLAKARAAVVVAPDRGA